MQRLVYAPTDETFLMKEICLSDVSPYVDSDIIHSTPLPGYEAVLRGRDPTRVIR